MNALLPYALLSLMSLAAFALLALNWPDLRRSLGGLAAGVRLFFLRSQLS